MGSILRKAYIVTIGTPELLYTPTSPVFPTKNDPTTTQAVTLTEHAFKASIKQTTGGYGSVDDETTIEVYNLGDTGFLNKDILSGIRIQAGTSEDKNLPVVYEGDIKKVFVEKNGVDTITTFICGSGSINKRQAIANRSFMAGHSVLDIIKYVAESFNMRIADFNIGDAKEDSIVSLYVVSGFSSTSMDKLCDTYELKWYIFNNELYVNPREAAERVVEVETPTTRVIETYDGFSKKPESLVEEEPVPTSVPTFNLTPDHVIGTVGVKKEIVNLSSEKEKVKHEGLKVRTFLLPELRMGMNLRLKGFEEVPDADYSIESITTELDSWDRGKWDSVLELGVVN